MINMKSPYQDRIANILEAHPELGITPVPCGGGKTSYVHMNTTPYDTATVKEITSQIHPGFFLPPNVAETIVRIIEKYNLGEHGLEIAQRNHYDALVRKKNGMPRVVASERAKEVAIKYDLDQEFVKKAELALKRAQRKEIFKYHVKKFTDPISNFLTSTIADD